MKKNWKAMMIGAVMGTMAAGMAVGAQAAQIGIDAAKQTALAAAQLTEDDVIFEKAAEDYDDGRQIYEVEFFVPGEMKYSFDIDANSGKILESDRDAWEYEDDFEYAALIAAAQEKGTDAAEKPSGDITEEMAKTIAMKDAGLDEGSCKVVKCRKDMDDGVMKFEVKLLAADGTEYDYDIRVSDGTIMDKDMDYADFDDDDDFDFDFD